MGDILILALRALNGGVFVVAFAVVAEMLEPKRFGGLFSAAPSVALASLSVVLIADGLGDGLANTSGMVVGSVALMLACALGILLVPKMGSRRGSVAICAAWGLFAITGWWMLP